MKGLHIGAVIVGLLVDVALSQLLSLPLGIFVGIQAVSSGQLVDPEALTASLVTSPVFLIFSLVAGLLGSLAGGYIAAMIGKEGPLINALLVGVVSALFGLFGIGSLPIWYLALSMALTVVAAWLGGTLRARQAPPTDHSTFDSPNDSPPLARP